MPPSSSPTERIPPWLAWLLSGLIGVHLIAVIANALAAPSGPWPSADGVGMFTPPQFAYSLSGLLAPAYNRPLHLERNYFATNRPGMPGVFLEFRLKDAAGNALETVRLPDEGANLFVRHHQSLLARGLGDDQPVPPPMGEVIAAPNQAVPMVQIWEMDKDDRKLKLKTLAQHLVPRDRPVERPSEMSLVLAHAYARHLCRTRGAAAVEVLRHHRDAIPPAVLTMPTVPPGEFDEMTSDFGEFSR